MNNQFILQFNSSTQQYLWIKLYYILFLILGHNCIFYFPRNMCCFIHLRSIHENCNTIEIRTRKYFYTYEKIIFKNSTFSKAFHIYLFIKPHVDQKLPEIRKFSKFPICKTTLPLFLCKMKYCVSFRYKYNLKNTYFQ